MYQADKPLLLGSFELETLEYLWEHGGGNAKTVHSVIGRQRGNTLNTVQSTLDRLYRKELLEREKQGHAFQYRCKYDRSEVLAKKFDDLATELSGGEIKSVFAAFVSFASRLDDAEIDQLEKMISEHRKNRKKTPPDEEEGK